MPKNDHQENLNLFANNYQLDLYLNIIVKTSMNLGYFTFPVHPKTKSLDSAFKEDTEAVLLIDKLGYDEAFFGEHMTDEYERITSSLLFISSLIHKTKKIRLGTGTLNLPHHNPAQIASDVSMIDHISKGRLIMGIGPGSLTSDMEAFGTLEKNRNEMFLESINQILKIWSSKAPYEIKGKYWDIITKKTYDNNLSIGKFMNTFQKPHPEIVCTSLSRNMNSIQGLSSRGWNLLSSNFLQEESLKYHYNGIKKGFKNKKNKNWRVARKIFVNQNKKVVENYVFSKKSPYYMTLIQIMKKLKKYGRLDVLKKNPEDKKEKIDPERILRDLVICGDVNSVAEKILELRKNVGNFDTITYVGIDWKNPIFAKNSLSLMSNQVMKIINKNL